MARRQAKSKSDEISDQENTSFLQRINAKSNNSIKTY